MVTEADEEQVFNEFLHEAEEEVKTKPVDDGRKAGITGIVLGLVGLVMPLRPLRIVFGFLAAGFAAYANKHGSRDLAVGAAVLALLDLASFFIFG